MSTPAPQAARAPVAEKGGKKPVILGAVVLLLAAGGYVGYGQLKREEQHDEVQAKPAPVLEADVVEIEPFIVNLADPAGDRFLRIVVRLVLDQKAVVERLGSGLPAVKLRDRLLSVLSKKRASELVTVEGKERLRGELLAAMEALLAEPPLHDEKTDPVQAHALDVLFTEFLVQ